MASRLALFVAAAGLTGCLAPKHSIEALEAKKALAVDAGPDVAAPWGDIAADSTGGADSEVNSVADPDSANEDAAIDEVAEPADGTDGEPDDGTGDDVVDAGSDVPSGDDVSTDLSEMKPDLADSAPDSNSDVLDASSQDAAPDVDASAKPDVPDVKSCPATCNDDNVCTSDACIDGSCKHFPVEDGLGCGNNAKCQAGVCQLQKCQAGTKQCMPEGVGTCQADGTWQIADCDDNDPCTADGCANGACTSKPTSGLACDDKNPCTLGDMCGGGKCAGQPKVCADSGCLPTACDATSGECKPSCGSGPACGGGQVCLQGGCAPLGLPNVKVVAGQNEGYKDGPALSASFNNPQGVEVLSDGSILVGDVVNFRIRKVSADGVVSTLAGTSVQGYKDGPAAQAQFYLIRGIKTAADGTIYIAETALNPLAGRVRRLSTTGDVTTFAGGASAGSADGPGSKATFHALVHMAWDLQGNLLVADEAGHSIRKITPDGVVSTVLGGNGAGGKDGPVNVAQLNGPTGVAVDPAGAIYVSEGGSHRVRRIGPDGIVSTVLGNGTEGASEGKGTQGQLSGPVGIAWHPAGFLVVTEAGLSSAVRSVWPDGTNKVLVAAGLSHPKGIAVGPSGVIVVADTSHSLIKSIAVTTGVCDDGDPCTADACDLKAGCKNTKLSDPSCASGP